MKPLVPVVLAGGTGSRLWPLSRELFPKQFHALFGDDSLLQSTFRRASLVCEQAPIVVCNEEHRFLVAEQARQIDQGVQRIILEPEGRNTAPAIALAALEVCDAYGDGLLLVLPSDHLIRDTNAFQRAVQLAASAAEAGGLVTFGIEPASAETGYGYIEAPGAASAEGPVPVRSSWKNRIRPRLTNTWRPATFSGTAACLCSVHKPIWMSCRVSTGDVRRKLLQAHVADLDFLRPGPSFLNRPADSIDYAVMEKTGRAQVLPVAFHLERHWFLVSHLGMSPSRMNGNHQG